MHCWQLSMMLFLSPVGWNQVILSYTWHVCFQRKSLLLSYVLYNIAWITDGWCTYTCTYLYMCTPTLQWVTWYLDLVSGHTQHWLALVSSCVTGWVVTGDMVKISNLWLQHVWQVIKEGLWKYIFTKYANISEIMWSNQVLFAQS